MCRTESTQPVSRSLKYLAPVAVTLLLSACAATPTLIQPSGSTAKPVHHHRSHTDIASQQISGKLLDRNGRTPVAGVTVYVANREAVVKRMLNNLSLKSPTTENNCPAPSEPHFAFTCTRADGSFELPVTQLTRIPAPLVMTKGEVRAEVELGLNDLGTDIGLVTFNQSGNDAEETIAIVLDFFDPYDDISNKLNSRQLDPEAAFLVINDQISEVLDMENSNQHIEFPKFAALFEDNDGDDKADIFNYSSVYLNSRDADDITNMDKEQKKQLLKFIANGGQLYVTEWTIEQAEPSLDQYI